jgi:hypothetical protein
MPYTMMIYLDEYEKLDIPNEGDTFIVVRVAENVQDLHWGMGTSIELEPIRIESNTMLEGEG